MKIEPSNVVIRILNCIVAGLLIAMGIYRFFSINLINVVFGVYSILFGLAVVALEFFKPEFLSKYCLFLFNHFGRGLFYIFISILLLGNSPLEYAGGAIAFGLGVVYIVLHFGAS